MTYVVIQANAVRWAGRSEAWCVGEVEADSQAEAEQLAADRRPEPKVLTVRPAGRMVEPPPTASPR